MKQAGNGFDRGVSYVGAAQNACWRSAAGHEAGWRYQEAEAGMLQS